MEKTGDMGVLTRYEVEKLMKKLSRERARIIKDFVTKAYALDVGQDFFQCHLSSLPSPKELQGLLNNGETDMRFRVWPTINGIVVKREV